MVTASVVLVVAATLTLVIGIVAGMDSLIFTSIASSVLAGALLIKSVLDDRKSRLATDGPASWAPPPTPTTTFSPPRVEEQPTSITIGQVDEEPEEEVELDRATVIVGGSSDAGEAEDAVAKPKRKTPARATATRSTAKKASAPATSSAKKTASKAATSKAKTAAKPKSVSKSSAAKPKTPAKAASAKTSAAPAKPAAKKASKPAPKKTTAKPKSTGSKVVPAPGEE